MIHEEVNILTKNGELLICIEWYNLLIRVMRLQYRLPSKSYDKVLNDIVLINQNNEVTT